MNRPHDLNAVKQESSTEESVSFCICIQDTVSFRLLLAVAVNGKRVKTQPLYRLTEVKPNQLSDAFNAGRLQEEIQHLVKDMWKELVVLKDQMENGPLNFGDWLVLQHVNVMCIPLIENKAVSCSLDCNFKLLQCSGTKHTSNYFGLNSIGRNMPLSISNGDDKNSDLELTTLNTSAARDFKPAVYIKVENEGSLLPSIPINATCDVRKFDVSLPGNHLSNLTSSKLVDEELHLMVPSRQHSALTQMKLEMKKELCIVLERIESLSDITERDAKRRKVKKKTMCNEEMDAHIKTDIKTVSKQKLCQTTKKEIIIPVKHDIHQKIEKNKKTHSHFNTNFEYLAELNNEEESEKTFASTVSDASAKKLNNDKGMSEQFHVNTLNNDEGFTGRYYDQLYSTPFQVGSEMTANGQCSLDSHSGFPKFNCKGKSKSRYPTHKSQSTPVYKNNSPKTAYKSERCNRGQCDVITSLIGCIKAVIAEEIAKTAFCNEGNCRISRNYQNIKPIGKMENGSKPLFDILVKVCFKDNYNNKDFECTSTEKAGECSNLVVSSANSPLIWNNSEKESACVLEFPVINSDVYNSDSANSCSTEKYASSDEQIVNEPDWDSGISQKIENAGGKMLTYVTSFCDITDTNVSGSDSPMVCSTEKNDTCTDDVRMMNDYSRQHSPVEPEDSRKGSPHHNGINLEHADRFFSDSTMPCSAQKITKCTNDLPLEKNYSHEHSLVKHTVRSKHIDWIAGKSQQTDRPNTVGEMLKEAKAVGDLHKENTRASGHNSISAGSSEININCADNAPVIKYYSHRSSYVEHNNGSKRFRIYNENGLVDNFSRQTDSTREAILNKDMSEDNTVISVSDCLLNVNCGTGDATSLLENIPAPKFISTKWMAYESVGFDSSARELADVLSPIMPSNNLVSGSSDNVQTNELKCIANTVTVIDTSLKQNVKTCVDASDLRTVNIVAEELSDSDATLLCAVCGGYCSNGKKPACVCYSSVYQSVSVPFQQDAALESNSVLCQFCGCLSPTVKELNNHESLCHLFRHFATSLEASCLNQLNNNGTKDPAPSLCYLCGHMSHFADEAAEHLESHFVETRLALCEFCGVVWNSALSCLHSKHNCTAVSNLSHQLSNGKPDNCIYHASNASTASEVAATKKMASAVEDGASTFQILRSNVSLQTSKESSLNTTLLTTDDSNLVPVLHNSLFPSASEQGNCNNNSSACPRNPVWEKVELSTPDHLCPVNPSCFSSAPASNLSATVESCTQTDNSTTQVKDTVMSLATQTYKFTFELYK